MSGSNSTFKPVTERFDLARPGLSVTQTQLLSVAPYLRNFNI